MAKPSHQFHFIQCNKMRSLQQKKFFFQILSRGFRTRLFGFVGEKNAVIGFFAISVRKTLEVKLLLVHLVSGEEPHCFNMPVYAS